MLLNDWWSTATLHPWLLAPLIFSLLTSTAIWFGRFPRRTENFLLMALLLPSLQLALLGPLAIMAGNMLTEQLTLPF
ncbi:MAG: hypothetical protein MI751_08735 [Pseudomonadales bacterium]|mgnify:FL=1|nr:hypothetical protein [Pseudomonadales bacterium]